MAQNVSCVRSSSVVGHLFIPFSFMCLVEHLVTTIIIIIVHHYSIQYTTHILVNSFALNGLVLNKSIQMHTEFPIPSGLILKYLESRASYVWNNSWPLGLK